jgi:hypothetical protein
MAAYALLILSHFEDDEQIEDLSALGLRGERELA